jgi:hypothetical protein
MGFMVDRVAMGQISECLSFFFFAVNSIINLYAPGFKSPPRSAIVPRFLERGFNFQRLFLEKKSYLVDFSSKCKEIKFRSVFMN